MIGRYTNYCAQYALIVPCENRTAEETAPIMIDKSMETLAEAVSDIPDGASIMIGGFGEAGGPIELIHSLIDHGARDLSVISNNAGNGHIGLAALIREGRVRKWIGSYPRSSNSVVFTELFRAGKIELELVPQGTMAARIHAGGSGIPAFYTATGVGTTLAEGKEVREFHGKKYLMEEALTADFALVRCDRADRLGNLTFNMAARNFSPIMCMASRVTIVQARVIEEPGAIDPEHVITPGIFVARVIEVENPVHESDLVSSGASYP